MPILNVKVGAARSDELTSQIIKLLAEITAGILGKDPAVTAVAIDYVDPRDWFAGGKSLAEQDKSSVYFDIKITDGTNTKDEKARYVRAAFDGFSKILGNLHHESYIYVQDVRADAYGYGGQTQEWRYHHPSA
ncbi:tautomerase family protein [Phyllobacterium leguminum]|uniref:4-oxalocrotonate tautomerase n=1 Tax=Phyllobacterium leguminum TaxID=314237 RepID=A0A318SY28_9HYPH|nr:4-oxalocrotonate tautomerase family protein [Phyllobacterium leguminum]PYE86952.1 4-oxalocrotonate tautomerase [Phyllobacterium leguminum]